MNTPSSVPPIPNTLARYHERALSVMRYQFGPGTVGPRANAFPAYTAHQTKFLCDIAQALHNLTEDQGVTFFFSEAARINAAWKEHLPELLEEGSYRHYFQALWPLPEEP